jgi:hypothetical protein
MTNLHLLEFHIAHDHGRLISFGSSRPTIELGGWNTGARADVRPSLTVWSLGFALPCALPEAPARTFHVRHIGFSFTSF